MTANLATLKQVCESFEVERYETGNIEKKWKAWLDNFDICTEYEGIENPKKRRAALLASGWTTGKRNTQYLRRRRSKRL